MKYLVFFYFILFCCLDTYSQDSCVYKNKNKYETIVLKKDSTFKYYYNVGLNHWYSSGKWNKVGEIIILNSDFKGIEPSLIIVAESKTCSEDSICFFIKSNLNMGRDLPKHRHRDSLVIILDGKEIFTMKNKFLTIPLIKFSSMRFKYSIGDNILYTIPYYVKDKLSNHYIIEWDIDFDLFHNVIINDTLIIRKNSLKGKKTRWYKQNN